ncbi:esterase-like activity of phytase family protein [Longispora sp. K20-0274]|uniref:esterase-like activity of phytase family protein n=1 Tax=Longispora sp. K20-0274 TaxID=3088255 RepID=UPI00399BBF57
MRTPGRFALAVSVAALTIGLSASTAGATPTFGQATLTGFAVLPARTFVPGSEPAGAALGTTPVNGVSLPFADQPVQGFSGVLRNSDGTFDVISDNGFGNKANSGDFLLRIHRLAPDFASGKVDVVGGITLTDPDGRIPFALTRPDRVLTGSDFDIESITRTPDGSYWIGDEFGPYLLHVDRAGRVLQAPIPLPGVKAPESHELEAGEKPNLGGSKGFEGMVRSVDGKYLYPLLEGTVAGDAPGALRFNEFELKSGAYTGRRWTYQLESPSNSIGDAIAVDPDRFLVVERDNLQGAAAVFKKVFLVDRRDRDKDGRMDKTVVADLMSLANPQHLGGAGDTFTFPHQCVEDLVILDDRTIGVLNDNNLPFSAGRVPGQADPNEFITIRLSERLHAYEQAKG